ncbi:alpha/beta hydrolase family protein [Erythrobacter litoralis]|uniref:Prolyl oligopeptidase family protein n=1 Tax=Erythrobacter litoralis (strain HTCC2594) TaxID=314225 RepID=Q2NAS7_ERYLH|nr:S9 family peptidase [Erythrobacter litoralis]ABC63214.1 prolyl oligopeptidase family protein [Erythrobacter litoralis HTCC2594]
MKYCSSLAALAAAAFAAPLAAQTLAEDASAFGARQSVENLSISPSGDRLLYIQPGAQSDETIYVVDLANGGAPTPIITMNEAQARLNWCQWATEERIVCEIFGMQDSGGVLLNFTRVMAISADGSDTEMLTPSSSYKTMGVLQDGGDVLALDVEGQDSKILMTKRYIKERCEKTRLCNDKEGLGVDAVDVENGRARPVEDAALRAVSYMADGSGQVRVMLAGDTAASGYDGSDYRYLYRRKGESKWYPLSSVDAGGPLSVGFRPVGIDSEKDVVYGLERKNGYDALYAFALDGSESKTLVMALDDVDVDGVARIGRQRRVVGANFATERAYTKYFDPQLEKLADAFAKALPGNPSITIADASADENELILIASSDTDPGKAYLFEKDTRSLSELLSLRMPLDSRSMGKMKPVTYPAADGTQVPGYLTLPPGSDGKNLPAIVMPHGGPGSRDVWGFDWLVQFFAARGYAVLQPNFRGSSGYGSAWFGKNGFQAWETAIGDINDAGRWLVSQGIADATKLATVGWSYGGYAALQSQVVDPDLFKAVVAIAPVTDLDLLREENRRYTSYTAYDRMIGNGAHVQNGSPARHAANFKAPVLLVHGTLDQNVTAAQSKLMENRLQSAGKSVDYLEFKGLDHGLVHSQARGIMLKRIGEFLEANLAF